jgi:hypothetical protein
MKELSRNDLMWMVRRAPRAVIDLMKEKGDKIVCAGGFVRSCITNETVNDMDLFCQSTDDAKQIATQLHESVGKSNHRWFETENAYTVHLRIPVQFIHRWTFDTPLKVVESFDFTIASAAFWYDKEASAWKSVCDEDFYADLAGRRLVYRAPLRNEDAGGSLLRVLKFYQRGYRIPLDSFGEVIARLVRGVDDERLRGLYFNGYDKEQAWAKVLTGLLREVDPLVDAEHIAHLPSLDDENEDSQVVENKEQQSQ